MDDSKAQQLLSGAQRFDLDCLAEIYDRFSPGLCGYAMRLLEDIAQAKDCVAETLPARLKQPVFRGPSRLRRAEPRQRVPERYCSPCIQSSR